MQDGLKDKVVLIAGAGGIATASVRLLAASGARLVIGDRHLDFAESAAAAAVDAGGAATAVQFDIADETSVDAFFAHARDAYGAIDGLFNIAADISPENLGPDGDAVEVPLEVWRHTLDVNLTGYLHTIRRAVPELLARGGGPIVNTISGAAYMGEIGRVSYGVSKAGLTALTRHVARRWGKEGIRCNAIAPGLVLTPAAVENVGEDEIAAALALLPTPRFGKPDDIASMARLLLSDEGEWINGQCISVDGGMVMRP